MRIDQTRQTLLKIRIKILLNLFSDKYGLKLGEFYNTTGTERVKVWQKIFCWNVLFLLYLLWCLTIRELLKSIKMGVMTTAVVKEL